MSNGFLNASTVEITAWIVLISLGLFAIVGFGLSAYAHFREMPKLSHVICHHEGGAATQARMLQLILEQTTHHNCYIDSDHLIDLDTLFSVVRSFLSTLVVHLTRNTMTRPWCMGEMTTIANKVHLVLFHCSDYVPFSDEELNVFSEPEERGMFIARQTRLIIV